MPFNAQSFSAYNHKVYTAHHYSLNKRNDGWCWLFFVVTIAVSQLSKVQAQPGYRAEEDSKLTGNGPLTAGQPLLQLANSTVCPEDNIPKATMKPCICSLVDLRQAYLDLRTTPGSRPQDSTIFIPLLLYYVSEANKQCNDEELQKNMPQRNFCCIGSVHACMHACIPCASFHI